MARSTRRCRPWPARSRSGRDRDRDDGQRTDRQAGHHQSRREGGEGRPALRLRGAGRGRRRQGPRRLRRRQGARGARGDPQGDRAAKRGHDPRAAARRPHAASRRQRPLRRRQGDRALGPAGTGIIAGGPMRAVFETLGVHDVVAKSVGTSNPHNMIKATFEALQQQTRRARSRHAAARRSPTCSAAATAADGRSRRLRRSDHGRRQEDQDHPDRQPDRPHGRPARDADRPRPEQAASQPRARGHARRCAA